MRHLRWGLCAALLGLMVPVCSDAGELKETLRNVHTPRKYEFPANGHWGYKPTWRDEDPSQFKPLRQRTYFHSHAVENKIRNYFGDYIFMRAGTEMQYTWDVPSYKRSVR